MKHLVRGGSILTLTSMFVAIIFAQTNTGRVLNIAKELQPITENNILDQTIQAESADTPDTKELVKKTVSITSRAGASKGSFSATAYCLSGRTAMGHGVRRGIIAADPRVLKLGSKVTIDAGPWSGTYLVSDTGGAVKGKKIDIWVPSCSEARKFGRRSVHVYSAQ
jgi:3D (Asp-Asp-Asp) domain-containing protein